MLLAYPLLFFLVLHLSASTCDATSRNHRVFFYPVRSDVPSPSPVIHRHIAKDLFYDDAHYPNRIMGATPPPPPLPGVEDLRRPPDKEISGATMTMAPSPSSQPQVVDNCGYYGEPGGGGRGEGGGDVSGGGDGEGGPPPLEEATATDVDNIGFDYAEPKTHPPSHH